jgi:hypothetical protein
MIFAKMTGHRLSMSRASSTFIDAFLSIDRHSLGSMALSVTLAVAALMRASVWR